MFRYLLLVVFIFVGCTKPEPVNKKASDSNEATYYLALDAEPQTLNPIKSSDLYARKIFSLVVEGLAYTDLNTYEPLPALATSWEVADDGLTYTINLRKGVKFTNGEVFNAHTFKRNFDMRMDDAYEALSSRSYIENAKVVEVIDDHTLKVVFAEKYFGNFDYFAGGILSQVPIEMYKDPKAKLNKTVVGTGPYMLDKYDKGRSITLKKNPEWWGWKETHPYYKGIHQFDKIHFKFVKEETRQLEMLKKGQIDFIGLTAEQYVKKAVGEPWGTKVKKLEVQNSGPKGYGFVGWNFKNKLFQNKNVRVALTHLMNRQLMIDKFAYSKSELATGPWFKGSPYANKNTKPLLFDSKKAIRMLAKEGWTDSDKDGVLDKVIDGNKTDFKFTLMFSNRDSEKYFTIYKEDLKKAGIDMSLKIIEWNSFVKALDEQKFDAVNLGWGGGSVHNDPKQIWHSESAKPGGSNFISYKNAEVDKLIDEGRKIIDNKERAKEWAKVYDLIAQDAPYVFMFNKKYDHYAVTEKIGMKKPTYNYGIGQQYWYAK